MQTRYLKDKLYVVGQLKSTELHWLLGQYDITDSTVIQLGNALKINSYNHQRMLDIWLDETSEYLIQNNANLIMLMGDLDNPELFKQSGRHNIKFIHQNVKIDSCLFLPKGLQSPPHILKDDEDYINEHRFILDPEKLISSGVFHVFSVLSPYTEPQMQGILSSALSLAKKVDFANIKLADVLIRQQNHLFTWYFSGDTLHQFKGRAYFGVNANQLLEV
jgi:hypothetical protein